MQYEWTVFFGDAADAEARVYVLARPITEPADVATASALEGLKITGRVEGPKCRYSHTLPARIPVRHRGVRTNDGRNELGYAELVGEAIVPDPNFWTPELPFLYRATVEVRRGDEVVAKYEQDFGIRPLGVRGKRLVFDGKTWVPRAVRRDVVVGEAPLELWRETATVMVVDDPSDEICREASEIGVILFAKISVGVDAATTCRRLGRFAAVAMVLLQSSHGDVPTDVTRNIIPAQLLEKRSAIMNLRSSTRVAVFLHPADGSPGFFGELEIDDRFLPGIVQRNATPRGLIEARAACDTLQADLASEGDIAGYIV